MSIRGYKKDRLAERALPLSPVPDGVSDLRCAEDDPLRFWTSHPSDAVHVDLRVFRDGETKRLRAGGVWRGPFTGRPVLIAELAPIIRELAEYATSGTVRQYHYSFRAWWRLFDAMEVAVTRDGMSIGVVERVADVSEVHRQYAFDAGMGRQTFGNFVLVANLARKAHSLPPLYWNSPEAPGSRRHLAPQWQYKKLRIALKHKWFSALQRWDRAGQLLDGREPQTNEEKLLLMNYQRFQSSVNSREHPRPPAIVVRQDVPPATFSDRGYSIPVMLRGFYPDAKDIRVAFHLCLASTGWNPAVLLQLDVNAPFIEPHPKDPARYLMRGFKRRGKSEQITQGLYKSKASAGSIVAVLVNRTEPLRAQLRKELAHRREEYDELNRQGAGPDIVHRIRTELVELEHGVRSAWLYVTSANERIRWLTAGNFASGADKVDRSGFLDELIDDINKGQPRGEKLSHVRASDFRDAFAAYAYQFSGGMVLYVMRVLGHKSPNTTRIYLDNTLVNEQTDKVYSAFSESLWQEIRLRGKVDPAILAKWSRDGTVTHSERMRLDEYRSLRRSRIGVGCKDPMHPPKRIAPNFIANGRAMCPVQRCLLCLEHAVIFPDSLPGLCKRLAELRYIQSGMASLSFIESSFGEEAKNLELALSSFDAEEFRNVLSHWEDLIASGQHRVIEFDGV